MNGFNQGRRVSKSGIYSFIIIRIIVIIEETIAVNLAACFAFSEWNHIPLGFPSD